MYGFRLGKPLVCSENVRMEQKLCAVRLPRGIRTITT